ncbi:hypothetical protein C8T65DRAFT_629417 [Cerioporus squamosus]|nr:hypothetical protein C8T65DRAFT_629417 [Cerioporus squamosus]
MVNAWLTLRTPILFPFVRSIGAAGHCRTTSTSTRAKKVSSVDVKAAENGRTMKTVKTVKAIQTAQIKAATEDHIDQFFASYPGFDYQPTAPFFDEFKRLTKLKGWDERQKKQERGRLEVAMAKLSTSMYGREEDDLLAWQRLCSALGTKPIPESLDECRRLVSQTHVNLVDFIANQRDPGQPFQTFGSEDELSTYTRLTEKVYGLSAAKRSGLLSRLLRHIYSIREECQI